MFNNQNSYSFFPDFKSKIQFSIKFQNNFQIFQDENTICVSSTIKENQFAETISIENMQNPKLDSLIRFGGKNEKLLLLLPNKNKTFIITESNGLIRKYSFDLNSKKIEKQNEKKIGINVFLCDRIENILYFSNKKSIILFNINTWNKIENKTFSAIQDIKCLGFFNYKKLNLYFYSFLYDYTNCNKEYKFSVYKIDNEVKKSLLNNENIHEILEKNYHSEIFIVRFFNNKKKKSVCVSTEKFFHKEIDILKEKIEEKNLIILNFEKKSQISKNLLHEKEIQIRNLKIQNETFSKKLNLLKKRNNLKNDS